MIPPDVHAARRERLLTEVPGPVLLLGHEVQARNAPDVPWPFRQDSTFWYFTGCTVPGAGLWLEGGEATLYLPPVPPDDALWHGATPSPETLGEQLGLPVRPFDELDPVARTTAARTLALADPVANARLTAWTGRRHDLASGHLGDPLLVDAVCRLRRAKGPEEVAELRTAARVTATAHEAAIRATRPGRTERSLAALFEAVLTARDATPGYGTILTQHGEILHHHAHDGVCEAGRLVLLDGGAELHRSGYGADVTRTWPVSGRWTARQRAAYEAVLAAQTEAIACCTPGTPWPDVHDVASRVIARFLLDEGLLRHTSVDDAVQRGAHALFFPHGIGHLLGLDVHDLGAFGDRGTWPEGSTRPEAFGARYLRLGLPLEAGWVVTVEPGFYVVPAILGDATLRERFADVLDLEVATTWMGFGGIRIEDDVLVRDGPPEVLTDALPRDPDAVAALVGSGIDAEVYLP